MKKPLPRFVDAVAAASKEANEKYQEFTSLLPPEGLDLLMGVGVMAGVQLHAARIATLEQQIKEESR